MREFGILNKRQSRKQTLRLQHYKLQLADGILKTRVIVLSVVYSYRAQQE